MIGMVHTASSLDCLRENGRIVAKVHRELKKLIKPGISTMFLEDTAKEIIYGERAVPGFLGYKGYGYATCISLNEEIVHGAPSHTRFLEEGDLISIDVGTYLDGFFGDAARSWIVGQPKNEEDVTLLRATRECLNRAIQRAKSGITVGTLGEVIERHATKFGFYVVKNYIGHGIGRSLHMFPAVYNYKSDDEGIILKEGMVIAIEPMLVLDCADNYVLDNGWTVVTANGKNSAHEEHTVVIHKDYAEIITC